MIAAKTDQFSAFYCMIIVVEFNAKHATGIREYSHLSNKRGGGEKNAKSLNMEVVRNIIFFELE